MIFCSVLYLIKDGCVVYSTLIKDGCVVYSTLIKDGCVVYSTLIKDGCVVYSTLIKDGCVVYSTAKCSNFIIQCIWIQFKVNDEQSWLSYLNTNWYCIIWYVLT